MPSYRLVDEKPSSCINFNPLKDYKFQLNLTFEEIKSIKDLKIEATYNGMYIQSSEANKVSNANTIRKAITKLSVE
jgi:hypothetical protein